MLLLSWHEVAHLQRVEFQETCLNVIEMQNVHFKPNLAHFSTFVVDWGAKSCQTMPLQMWVVTIAVKRKGSCLRQVDGVTWASCGQVTGNLRAPLSLVNFGWFKRLTLLLDAGVWRLNLGRILLEPLVTRGMALVDWYMTDIELICDWYMPDICLIYD